MFKPIRRFWPFKTLLNFTVTALGCSVAGLMYYSTQKQRIFTGNPIISQGLKFMNENSTLKNLLGYPLVCHNSFYNTSSDKENQKYYYFEVKGSKQQIYVELIATKKKISELKYDIHAIQNVNLKIISHSNQLKLLQNNLNNLKKSKMKNKQKLSQKSLLQQNILNKQNQLFDLKTQKQKLQKYRNQSISKYYIPQLDLYAKSLKNQSPQSLISDDQYVYGIQQLIAHLPNHNKLNIILKKSNPSQQHLPQQSPQLIQQKYNNLIFNQGYLRTRIKQGLGSLTDKQIQSYSKHKTQMMYNSVLGGQRILIGFSFFIIGVFAIIYLHDNRLQSIAGTSIQFVAEEFLKTSLKSRNILANLQLQINQIKFDKLYIGGKKGHNFNCIVDINGFPGAKAIFEGKQNNSSGLNVSFVKYYVQYLDGKQIKKINLLS